MNRHPIAPSSQRQNGAALIVGLLFLVVLTMIGVTAARMSSLEERMSGNLRDRSLAMQAAELALRDAERDILGLGVIANKRATQISGLSYFWPDCNMDGADDTDDDGLCDRKGVTPTYGASTLSWPALTVPNGTVYPAIALDMTTTPSIEYGTFTGAPAIALVSAQPRYLIEGFTTTSNVTSYRITVRAQGANANTVVWLQEIFRQ